MHLLHSTGLPVAQFASLSLLVGGPSSQNASNHPGGGPPPHPRGETVIIASPLATTLHQTALDALDDLHSFLSFRHAGGGRTDKSEDKKRDGCGVQVHRPRGSGLGLHYLVVTEEALLKSCAATLISVDENGSGSGGGGEHLQKGSSGAPTSKLPAFRGVVGVTGIVLTVGISGIDYAFGCSGFVDETPSRLRESAPLLRKLLKSADAAASNAVSVSVSSATATTSSGKKKWARKEGGVATAASAAIVSSATTDENRKWIKALLASLISDDIDPSGRVAEGNGGTASGGQSGATAISSPKATRRKTQYAVNGGVARHYKSPKHVIPLRGKGSDSAMVTASAKSSSSSASAARICAEKMQVLAVCEHDMNLSASSTRRGQQQQGFISRQDSGGSGATQQISRRRRRGGSAELHPGLEEFEYVPSAAPPSSVAYVPESPSESDLSPNAIVFPAHALPPSSMTLPAEFNAPLFSEDSIGSRPKLDRSQSWRSDGTGAAKERRKKAAAVAAAAEAGTLIVPSPTSRGSGQGGGTSRGWRVDDEFRILPVVTHISSSPRPLPPQKKHSFSPSVTVKMQRKGSSGGVSVVSDDQVTDTATSPPGRRRSLDGRKRGGPEIPVGRPGSNRSMSSVSSSEGRAGVEMAPPLPSTSASRKKTQEKTHYASPEGIAQTWTASFDSVFAGAQGGGGGFREVENNILHRHRLGSLDVSASSSSTATTAIATIPVDSPQRSTASSQMAVEEKLRARLTVSVALNEDLRCSYKKSNLFGSAIEGLIQVQVKSCNASPSPSTSPSRTKTIPFRLRIKDPARHIKTIQESRTVVRDVTFEADEYNGHGNDVMDDDDADKTYLITLPRYDQYFPAVKYRCSDDLCPVPLRVQTRIRQHNEKCRVALQVSSNPLNSGRLSDLNIAMSVPDTVMGSTLTTSPAGGVWDPEKRSVLWAVAELGAGEKFQLQAQFGMQQRHTGHEETEEKEGEKLEFPVSVRCHCMYAQLSRVELGVGGDSSTPADVKMKLARRFRLSHRER